MKPVASFFGIALGALVTSFGLNFFLIPNRMNDGGLTGLAIVLHYLWHLPVGLMVLLLNVPLIAAVAYFIGAPFVARTLFGVAALSFWLWILPVHRVTGDLLLSAAFGGLFSGTGLGIVFRSQGSTGGTDLVARLLRYFTSTSMGAGLLGTDTVIIGLTAIFFGLRLGMYSAIALFVGTRVVDLIQEGIDFRKAAWIMSDRSEEISRSVMEELGRGVTLLHAEGGFTRQARLVLFCIVSRSEITRLKDIVYHVDRDAFLVITTVHEVLGEGFKELEGRRRGAPRHPAPGG